MLKSNINDILVNLLTRIVGTMSNYILKNGSRRSIGFVYLSCLDYFFPSLENIDKMFRITTIPHQDNNHRFYYKTIQFYQQCLADNSSSVSFHV